MIPLIAGFLGLFLLFTLAPTDWPRETETRWTAWLMVAAWAIAMAYRIRRGRSVQTRGWWTVAAGLFVIHVITAFWQAHAWSHAKAYDHVEETSGFGPGIFVSYLFTLVWLLDVLYWWLARQRYERRSTGSDGLLHGFMAFIMFNGTVVYEDGPIRWVGLVVFIFLGVLLTSSALTNCNNPTVGCTS